MTTDFWYGIKVAADANANKFYEMKADPAGSTFTARWGRVGTAGQSKVFPMSEWASTIRTREKHDYRDMTAQKRTLDAVAFKPLAGSVGWLVDWLQQKAGVSIAASYSDAESITEAQLAEAQRILDRIGGLNGQMTVSAVNAGLVELWRVLPRKMRKVADELLPAGAARQVIGAKLADEQALVDQLRASLRARPQPTAADQTVLDAIGLDIREASPAERAQVLALVEAQSKPNIGRIWRVIHFATQAKYDAWKPGEKGRLLFHGSKTPNFWSIMTQGLVIRPSYSNGWALGKGLYFADWAHKSISYTSLKGARWGGGSSDDPACMAVFSVKLGREKKVSVRQEDGHHGAAQGLYDSMHAVAPPNPISWPRRDEFTVYNDAQATIAFLVELVGRAGDYD